MDVYQYKNMNQSGLCEFYNPIHTKFNVYNYDAYKRTYFLTIMFFNEHVNVIVK